MNPLIGMIASQISGPVLAQIGQQIGADNNTTQSAISAALPMMLSAMGSQANANGADLLHQAALDNHSVLDDVMGFLGNAQGGNMGTALLGQVMGGNGNAIANAVGQHTGLDSGAVMQLLAVLAPIVMGALGKSSQAEGLDANGLAQLVGAAAGSTNGNDLMGLATKMLDSDGDGNVMEEIGGLINKFF
jgi:hypothetical protein